MTYPEFERLRFSDYTTVGIKVFTNALAWRFDVYHSCLNFCTYCFARALEQGALARLGIEYSIKDGRVGDVERLAKRFSRILDDQTIDVHDFIDWSIYKYWAPECGTMGEPFLDCDRKYGLTYGFLQMLKTYQFPLFVCTKCNLLVRDEKYYDALVDLKGNGLIVDVSLISLDDKLLKKYEPMAPSASERLKLIDRLCSDGVNVTISCRPFMAGLTDLDYENYIETLSKLGVKSIHIRQFYLTSYLVKRWKKWINAHKDILKRYGIGYKYKSEYLESWFEKAIEIAEPYNVAITGGSDYTLGKAHKMDYDLVDDEMKKHIFPYTVLPIHSRLIGTHPHLMFFDEYCKPVLCGNDEMLDAEIRIDPESYILAHSRCCQMKPRVPMLFKFRDILERSLWDGWDFGGLGKCGAITSASDIHRVVEKGQPILDDNGHFIFAYLPNIEVPVQPRDPARSVETEELKKIGVW